MSWENDLRIASFRGVEFKVRSHSLSGGHRGTTFEFPNNDTPYRQEKGKKAKEFSVTGYILGADYFYDRDRFITALDKGGSGTLVHPYYGSLNVNVVEWQQSETYNEGGICRFNITFVESGINQFPSENVKPTDQVLTDAASLQESLFNFMLKAYSIANKPYAAVSNVLGTVQDIHNLIGSAKRQLTRVAEFSQLLIDFTNESASLITDAGELATATLDILTFGMLPTDDNPPSDEDARQMITAMKTLMDTIPATSMTSGNPDYVFTNFTRWATMSAVASLFPSVNFTSYDEARGLGGIVFSRLEREIFNTDTPDEIVVGFTQLRRSMHEDIQDRSGNLSRTANLNLKMSIPAIVLSYDLYGTIDEEQNIIERNNVNHPGFIDNDTDLEVLIGI